MTRLAVHSLILPVEGLGLLLAHLVDERLEALGRAGDAVTEEQVLRQISEYDIQMVRKQPIPDWFYRRQRDERNSLWNVQRQRLVSGSDSLP